MMSGEVPLPIEADVVDAVPSPKFSVYDSGVEGSGSVADTAKVTVWGATPLAFVAVMVGTGGASTTTVVVPVAGPSTAVTVCGPVVIAVQVLEVQDPSGAIVNVVAGVTFAM
jgi:hypothetical protein